MIQSLVNTIGYKKACNQQNFGRCTWTYNGRNYSVRDNKSTPKTQTCFQTTIIYH